ncbi:hypothetical protein [Phenylobacterium sp.]|uniref:hypothetical protein n=1 Tax=Phenylobacterium sp. TaxID=1871053 RepID=UPI002F41F4EE
MTGGAFRTAGVAATFSLALGACANIHPPPPQLNVPPPAAAIAPKPAPLAAPPPVVVRVPVPVKEACIPKSFPRAPKYPDTDAALRDAGGAADRYQLMAAGRLLRDRRLAELERLVDGCR